MILIHASFLAGAPKLLLGFTADLRSWMRKVWRDIAGMNPLELTPSPSQTVFS